jgi:hypothetical protein
MRFHDKLGHTIVKYAVIVRNVNTYKLKSGTTRRVIHKVCPMVRKSGKVTRTET